MPFALLRVRPGTRCAGSAPAALLIVTKSVGARVPRDPPSHLPPRTTVAPIRRRRYHTGVFTPNEAMSAGESS